MRHPPLESSALSAEKLPRSHSWFVARGEAFQVQAKQIDGNRGGGESVDGWGERSPTVLRFPRSSPEASLEQGGGWAWIDQELPQPRLAGDRLLTMKGAKTRKTRTA